MIAPNGSCQGMKLILGLYLPKPLIHQIPKHSNSLKI